MLFRRVWGDVIVNTDTTPAGRKLTPPTPQQPVYYVGRSLGCRLGLLRGEDPPDDKEMNDLVVKILAKQGYLGAKPGVHEPTLFLVLQWGCVEPDKNLRWFLGYNPSNDIAASYNPVGVGPEVLLAGFRSYETEMILDNSDEPNFGIIVTAFDYKSARTAQPVALWQTRIALPIVGKTMAQALPPMIVAAGPAIGRPSDKPVLLNADSARAGTVELGELQILDVVKDPAADARTGQKK